VFPVQSFDQTQDSVGVHAGAGGTGQDCPAALAANGIMQAATTIAICSNLGNDDTANYLQGCSLILGGADAVTFLAVRQATFNPRILIDNTPPFALPPTAGISSNGRHRGFVTIRSEGYFHRVRKKTMGELHVQMIPVTPFQQNCALIWDAKSRQGAIIDPGGDLPKINAAIAAAGVTVENIYITHGHLDHAGGAAELARGLRVPIIGPDRRDAPLIADMASQSQRFGLKAEAFTPDRWLVEGDKFAIGGHEFEVLHCPGHTPGHVVFVNHAEKFMVLGDVLFRNSVGRTDFAYGDPAALISAITTKLLPLGDEYAFICGHGMGSTLGAERRSNPFLQ
jgi:hydroxyacylglutathione hydrolase